MPNISTKSRELEKEFTLKELYGFEDRPHNPHPDNKHVKDMITQQLQVLRDERIVEFVRRGHYRT
jgi:type II restriction enzyme